MSLRSLFFVSGLLWVWGLTALSASVYQIRQGQLELEKDRGQEGLRDIVPPQHQNGLVSTVKKIKKKPKELTRSKLTLRPTRVKGRVARPRLPFQKTPPTYVETNIYEDEIGTEQGRWEIYKDSLKAARSLRSRP